MMLLVKYRKDEGSVCSGSSNSDPPVQWTSNYPPEDEEDTSEPFRTQELMCWSFQIARGMKHLASRKVLSPYASSESHLTKLTPSGRPWRLGSPQRPFGG